MDVEEIENVEIPDQNYWLNLNDEDQIKWEHKISWYVSIKHTCYQRCSHSFIIL